MRIQCCQNVPGRKMHFDSKSYSFAYRFDGAFICSMRLHVLRSQSDIGSQAMRAWQPGRKSFKSRRSIQGTSIEPGRTRKSLKDRHPSHSECDKSLEGRAASQSRRAKSCKKRQLTQPRRERSLKRSWIDPAWTVLPIDFTAHGQCSLHVASFSSARACTIENQVKIDRK